MNRLPDIGQVSDLRLGDHPGFDAWFYSFCAENNIEHGINPSGVASPEQLRFMVAMDERQVYAPCSDATFRELAASFHLRSFPPRVRSQYIAAWRSIIRVVRYEKDRQKRRDMINYCRHRFRGCLALGNILPSRQAAGHHAHQPFRRGRSVAERAPVLQRNARLLPPFADPAEGPRTPARRPERRGHPRSAPRAGSG